VSDRTTFGRHFAAFAAYGLCVIAANAAVLRSMFVLSRQDATASHILLIPVVTLVLIVQQRRSIFESVGWDWQAGLGVVAGGLALSWIGFRFSQPSGALNDDLFIPALAIVVLAIGGFVGAFGRTASREALFPLLFLLFMVPIPGLLLRRSVDFLKRGSTEMVAAIEMAPQIPPV